MRHGPDSGHVVVFKQDKMEAQSNQGDDKRVPRSDLDVYYLLEGFL